MTVAFNNTYPAWGREGQNFTTLDVTKYYSEYVKENVIKNMTNIITKDKGNVTEIIQDLFENANFCETEMVNNFPWCRTLAHGLTNNSMIEILKLLRNFWDDWIRMWEDRRYKSYEDGIKQVLRYQKAVDIFTYYNKIMASMYYAIVIPVGDGVFGELKTN